MRTHKADLPNTLRRRARSVTQRIRQSGGTPQTAATGAIGPNNYLEFVDSRLGVYNRSTLVLTPSVAEDTFVHSTSTCDGQIKWDQAANRWLVLRPRLRRSDQ